MLDLSPDKLRFFFKIIAAKISKTVSFQQNEKLYFLRKLRWILEQKTDKELYISRNELLS